MKSAENIKRDSVMKRVRFLLIALLVGILNFNVNASEILNVVDEELTVENWMIVPFESALTLEFINDEVLSLEDWMATPFESSPNDELDHGELLTLESWMSTPFEFTQDDVRNDKAMMQENCKP